MFGAMIGDIVGSRFEFRQTDTKDFELFHPKCSITDDTVLTAAIAKAVMESPDDYEQLSMLAVHYMREIGGNYPPGIYGGMFREWLESENPQPYGSFGNGAAMRVSPCAWAAKSLKDAIALSRAVTVVTHDHPEGIKGAEATTVAIYLARKGKSKRKIRQYISKHYYPLDYTLESIRGHYGFDDTCQGSVPHAILAFLESESFEDAIRNAVALNGDSDTIAAIAGSIAEAYYGIPNELIGQAMTYLPEPLMEIAEDFRKAYQEG